MTQSASSERWLPATSYIVLGLLSFETRLTGYELRQWALGSTRFFWAAPAMSQIYRELERLESSGFVDQLDESGEHERNRTTYGLTSAGRNELRRWVNDAPFEPPTIRHPAAFRLFLGHVGDRERLVEFMTAQRDWADQVLADLATVEADLADADGFHYPSLVANWGMTFYGGEASATNDVIRSLDHDR